MLREIEHGLVDAQRRDSLPSAQSVVQSRQAETLAVAYLLTGDRDRAVGLAEAALLSFLRELKKLDPDADPRTRVLIHLGRHFLDGEHAGVPSGRHELIADAVPEKYAVENQRERTLTALSRLDDRERAALLLSDMCGIDPGELYERNNDTLAAPPETARERLRQSLDVPSGESLRPLLVEAGFDGPKDDLWPGLAGPYAEIQRREKRRGQLLTFSVVGGVILVAIVSIAVIFGPQLINDNEADAAAIATPTVVDDDLVIPSDPPISPTPTPTPPLPPVGDVPGTLLAQTYHDGRSNNPYSTLSVYEPDSNALRQVLDGSEELGGSNSGPILISPDGQQLILIQQDRTGTKVHYTATALDSNTLERQWETDIGTFEGEDEQSGMILVQLSAVVASESVYIAILSHEMPEIATLMAFNRRDGTLSENSAIDLEGSVIGTSDFLGNVFLFKPVDESKLVLVIEKYDRSGQRSQDPFVYQIALPTLVQIGDPLATDDPTGQTFGFWSTRVTPNSDALFNMTYTLDRGGSQMSFFNLDTGEMTHLPLPFAKRGGEPYVGTSSVLAPDGRTLYVLDQAGGHVAIVDLNQRKIERFFPLDTGEFDTLFGPGSDQFILGWANLISPDGTRLFVAADVGDRFRRSGPIEESGVWVIDLTQWRILDFWPVEGQASWMHSIPHEQTVLVSSWFYTSEQSTQMLTRFNMADGSTIQLPVDVPTTEDGGAPTLVSLVELYRNQHGRSPNIDGVEQHGLADFQTLPRIEASATTDNVAAGVTTSVEVRILDPASGEVLSSQNPNVRFDSGSTVTAILKAEDQSRQIIVLANIEPGVYRGSVTFPATGRWTIDVAVTGRDGTVSVSSDTGWIDVAPTFAGSDGRLYQFAITSQPEQPVIEEDITISLKLIDIESGVPLPEGVTLLPDQPALEGSSIEGMPERIDVALVFARGNQPGVYRTALLYQISPGIYEGTTQLKDAGTWAAEIRFQPPGSRRTLIPAGSIQVVGP